MNFNLLNKDWRYYEFIGPHSLENSLDFSEIMQKRLDDIGLSGNLTIMIGEKSTGVMMKIW